jgi:hypothetical protein
MYLPQIDSTLLGAKFQRMLSVVVTAELALRNHVVYMVKKRLKL